MKAVVAALVVAVLAGPAAAQQVREAYYARISVADHYNSSGVPLDNAAAIIRQDRANFHEFGIRDAEDQSDAFFAIKANGARLEALLRAGRMDKFTASAIVRGTPLVYVEVYDNYIAVSAQR